MQGKLFGFFHVSSGKCNESQCYVKNPTYKQSGHIFWSLSFRWCFSEKLFHSIGSCHSTWLGKYLYKTAHSFSYFAAYHSNLGAIYLGDKCLDDNVD